MDKKRIVPYFCSLFLVMALLLPLLPSCTGKVQAQSSINIVVYGQTLYSDVSPIIVNGRTLVPMRAIFEALGAEVSWDPYLQEVTGYRDYDVMVLQIDNNLGVINGTVIELDAAPIIYRGRTMVPVRFVAESLGESVRWEAQNSTVFIGSISSNNQDSAPLTEDQALNLIYEVTTPGGTRYMTENETFEGREYFVFRFYEVIHDGGGESHINTLNWYYVDMLNGSVFELNRLDGSLSFLG